MKVKIQAKAGFKILYLNRRRAIRERCLNCKAWYPQQVTKCTLTDCSLYPYRSGRGKQDPDKRKKDLRLYCLSCSNRQLLEVAKCPANDCPLYAFRKSRIDRSIEIVFEQESAHRESDSEKVRSEDIKDYALQKAAYPPSVYMMILLA